MIQSCNSQFRLAKNMSSGGHVIRGAC